MINNIEFELITIEMPRLQVCLGGKPVHVSLTQLRLLMIFLSEPYRRFTTSELISLVDLTDKRALATLINSVRVLLDQKYIFTVHGFGYVFAADRAYQEMNGVMVWGISRRKNRVMEGINS